MIKYRASVVKVLEDGTEIIMYQAFDFPWFVGKELQHMGKAIYIPPPRPYVEGQLEMELPK